MLASALKNHYVFAAALLLAAGAVVQFAGAELFQPAFAAQPPVAAMPDTNMQQAQAGNSYYRSVSESLSVVASHGSGSGTTSSPMSYQRSMSESMSVTTVQGKAPNSYSRSMSEQASLTTGMPSSAPAGPQARAAPAPYSASSNQRIDERFSLRNLAGSKTDSAYRNTVGGTSVYSDSMSASYELSGSDAGIIIQDTASVDGGESETGDNSALLRQLDAFNEYMLMQKSIENAALANLSTSAVLLLGTVAVVVVRQPAVSGGRLQNRVCCMIFLLKRQDIQEASFQKTHGMTRILVLVLVVFTSASIANAAEPVVGQAFGDEVAGIAYKTGSLGGLAYREWNPSTTSWGAPVPLTTAGTEIATVKFLYSPTSQLRVIGVLETSGEIDIYYCESVCTTAGNWVGPTLVANMGTPTAPRKYFDMAFEGSSGDLLIVYDKTTASDTNDFFYKVFDYETSTLSSESGFDYVSDTTTDNDIRFFKMASKPRNDEITMILLDATSTDTVAFVWDGSSFVNQLTVSSSPGTAAIAGESIGVAYESSSGAAMVFSADDTGGANLKGAFARWSGSSWSGPTQYDIHPGANESNLPAWFSVKANPDPASNQVMACNGEAAGNDLSCIIVTAGVPGTNTAIDASITGTGTRVFDYAWDPSGGTGIILYDDSVSPTTIKRRVFNGASFDAEGTFTISVAVVASWIVGATDTQLDATGVESLWVWYENQATTTTDDIDDGEWSAPTFTDNGDTTITGDAGLNGVMEVVAMDFRKTNVIPRAVFESLAVSEAVVAKITARAIGESLAITESIVKSESRSLSESTAMTDSIASAKFIPRSITEQAGLQDRIKRDLNGYSAGTVYVSNTGTYGLNSVKYRQWDPTANIWSYEVELPNTGSPIRDVRIAFSPVSEMRVVVSHSADGTLNLFRCDAVCIDPASWTLVSADFADTGAPDSLAPYRFFDIAFEQQSGTLLIVYDRQASQANDFYYRTYDGTTLSGELGYNYIGNEFLLDAETVPFIRMASKPNSDEIAMVLEDFTRQDAYAFIFDAATGAPSTSTQVTLTGSMGTTSIDGEAIGIAYEPGSGRAVAFSANNADSMSYSLWSGSSWSSVATVDPNTGASGNNILFMTVKPSPSPTNDQIMVCQVDDLLDLTCAEMENGALGSFTVIDTDVNSSTTRPFDFVWNQAGSAGTLLWGTSNDVVNYQTWNGASWGSPSTIATAGTHRWIVGHEAPTTVETTRAVFMATNSANMTGSLGIVGSSPVLIGSATHTTDTSSTVTEGMSIDWQFAGRRQPFRLPAETLALTDSIAISVTKPRSETMSLTESVRPASVKPLSENLALSETISRVVVKPLSESAALTDTITATRVIPRSMTEQLGVADTIARAFTGSRSPSEQLVVTESITKAVTKATGEQLGVTDIVDRAIVLSRSMSEQLGVTESAARSVVQSRAVSEQLAVTDTIAKAASKPLSEQLGVTDMIVRSIVSARTVTEQLAATDSVTKVVSYPLSESLGITESAGRAIIVSRSATEQLGMTESVTKAAGKTLTEQLGASDAVTRAIVTSRTLLEQLAATETIAMSANKALAEQIALSEQLVRSVVQSRPVSEQLAATDSVSIVVTKQQSEQLAVTDTLARTVVQSRSMSEQLGLSETVAAKVTSRAITESLAMADSVGMTVSRSMAEQLNMTESISTSALKSMAENLAATESISIGVSRSMTEQLGVSDAAVAAISAVTMADDIALSDAVSITISRVASDLFGITESISTSVSKSIADNMAISDTIVLTAPGSASESLSLTESITARPAKPLSDQLGVADSIAIAVAVSVADQLSMADSVVVVSAGEAFVSEQLGATEFIAIRVSKQVSDGIAISDAIMTAGSAGMTESMAATDAIARSVVIARAVSESLALSDSASGSPAVFVIITDSMAIDEDFTDISIVFNLNLAQTLVLAQGFATDFEGMFDQADGEGITIGDSVVLVLESTSAVADALALQDQVSASLTPGRGMAESMRASDSVLMLVVRPPPPPPAAVTTMPNLKITETENVDKFEGLVDPMEAVEIEGEWDISDLDEDSLESLLETMGMPVYDVDLEAASDDIDDLTMVVPTFWVSMEGDWSDGAGFLTPTLSNLPAGMEVVVPINIQASMEGDENLGMLGNMTVSFTPAQSAGNFTMLITILDDNPEADIASDPPNDIPAFFIDVIIVGDFPGMTPDTEAFFEVPPTITFTLTEEWAAGRGAERDSNNVPIIGLFLLDESNGSWLELTEDIEPPTAAVDNVYTYTATLPHFSTYVVTAGATGAEDGGNAGRRRSAEYARSIVESLLVSGSANLGAPGEGKAVARSMIESLTLRTIQPQPLHQRVITIQNVTVAVSVADIKPAAAFGTAVATLNFEITNKGDSGEELVLRYWYSDPASGERLYEGEQAVTVDAGQSLLQAVEIPFYSEGIFNLMIDAESDDGTLATTEIAINVPWLAVYLYVLVAIAVAVVLISIFYVIFAMRRSKRSPDEDGR